MSWSSSGRQRRHGIDLVEYFQHERIGGHDFVEIHGQIAPHDQGHLIDRIVADKGIVNFCHVCHAKRQRRASEPTVGQLIRTSRTDLRLRMPAAVARSHLAMEDEGRGPGSSDFGKLLRRYRLAAGLSQETLAERARVSLDGISALERGYRRSPQRETLALLAGALALSDDQRHAFEAAAARPRLPRRRGETSVTVGPWPGA